MRKVYMLTLLLGVFAFANAQQWEVYDGNVLPSETGSGTELDLSSESDWSPGANFLQMVVGDNEFPDNKLLKFVNPDPGAKGMYRHYFDGNTGTWGDSTFTLVARMKSLGVDSIERIFDLQWRNGNADSRDELRITPMDSTISLDRADVSVKVDMDLNEWHVYRVAVYGDSAAVFIDEMSDPVLTGVSTSSTSDVYIKVGDGGSTTSVAGYVDFLMLDTTNAYTPDESAIPDEYLNPYKPWLVYDANVLPAETGTINELLDISSESSTSPGDGFVQEVMDDPDISGNKILYYYQPEASGKYMYRSYFPDGYTDSVFTIAARIKGLDIDTIDRAFDIQWRNGNANSRDQLLIWPHDSIIELEKAGVQAKVDYDLTQWHTYRILVMGDSAAIFIDESDTPDLTGISTSSTGDMYIKLGDEAGSQSVGGYVDYIMMDITGAYMPSEQRLALKASAPYYPWVSYNGNALPENTGTTENPLDLTSLSQDGPGTGFVEEIVSDSRIPGNKLLNYYQPEKAGTRMYRSKFDDNWTDSTFTMVARLKGTGVDTIDRVFDIQWRNGNAGTRDELRIWGNDSIIGLDKAGKQVKVDMNLNDWHIYRVQVIGDSCAVFIDENPEAVITGVSTSSTSDTYIKIGDGSSTDAVGGFVDWFLMDTTMASNPETMALPDALPGVGPVEIGPWYLYTADVLPDANDPAFSESSVNGGTQENMIIADPDHAGNNLLDMRVYPAASSFLWKYNFTEEPQNSITMVARVKGLSDTLDRPVEFDFRQGGFRERLFINSDNTFELKYSGVKGDLPNVMNWHVFRISKAGDEVSFYLDENPVPLATVKTPEVDNGDNYFRFGDGNSSTSVGGLIDYVVWNESGAFSPDKLPIPDTLLKESSLSYDATLSALTSDVGELSPAFSPDVTDYELAIPEGTTTVNLTATVNDNAATVAGDGDFTDIPGTATITVTAEDGTTQDYTVAVRFLSSDATLSELNSGDVGTWDPAFSSDVTNYTLTVPSVTGSIWFTAVANDPNAVITGDGSFTDIGHNDTITVTAEDGTVMEYIINVQFATGISSLSRNGFAVYPNPASDVVFITAEKEVQSIEIYNMLGKMILTQAPATNELKIDISGLEKGLYIIKAKAGNEVSSVRFIKR